MDTTYILNKLINKHNLTIKETHLFLNDVIKGTLSPAQIGAILVALRMKGESSKEIVGFIKTMRKNMIHVMATGAIDVCGTGGDNSGTFNISSAVAFVIAGAGVKVVKHGNRAASSKCGSADVLEQLGINLQLSPQRAESVFKKVGMVFLFAPLFHPAMKNLVRVRKELKTRTIFNFLGPFTNPASVKKQLIGVPSVEIAKKFADVGRYLNYKHLLIVTSQDGLDEISIYSKTLIIEVKNNSVKKFNINPADYGFIKHSLKEIKGGNVEENAAHIRAILNGKKGPRRDIVVLNSACALYVAGAVKTIANGIKYAEESINSRKAQLVLQNLIRETQNHANHT